MIDDRRPNAAGGFRAVSCSRARRAADSPLSLGARGAFAAGAENVLKVGFISPRTGALGGFGQTDGYVLELARKALAGGLTIGGKTYEVQILDRDTQSDPSRAGQLAKTLINSDKIDLMLAVSTPETINPVADACEAAGVPCLSTVMPWEAWYFGRGAKPGRRRRSNGPIISASAARNSSRPTSRSGSLIPTNKKVGVLYPNDADGNAIRANLAPALAKAGFTIIDPGPYEDGTTDYSAQIAKFKAEKCEIFNTFPIPPDFAAFWRQAAQQGYTKMVKIAQIAKTGLFPAEVEALGDLGFNLASACYWHKAFPYKSVAHRRLRRRTRRRLREGSAASNGRSSSAPRWRCSTPASPALKASGAPKDKAAVAKAIGDAEDDDDRRQGRLHPRPGSQRLAGTDHRHAMGEGAGRARNSSSTIVITENATDPNVPIGAKLQPFNGVIGRGRNAATAERRRRPARASGIHKRFNALVVLDGVDFHVRADEAVGIVGPERRRQDDDAQRAGRRAAADRGRRFAFAAQDVTASAGGGALPAGPGAHASDPAPVQRHDGVRECLRRRRARRPDCDGERSLRARDRALRALRHDARRQPQRRNARPDRPQAARTRARARRPARGAAARRNRRRPHRRRGGRTRRHHPSSCARSGIAIVWIEHIVHILLQVAERLVCMDAGRIIADGEPRRRDGRSRP